MTTRTKNNHSSAKHRKRRRATRASPTYHPNPPNTASVEPGPSHLKALVIGAFVRGLSMRDVESLCEQAGLGKLSRSTASRICEELRERLAAFKQRSLYDTRLVPLFLDATFIAVRRSGPKEGVLVAWGFTAEGEHGVVGEVPSHHACQPIGPARGWADVDGVPVRLDLA